LAYRSVLAFGTEAILNRMTESRHLNYVRSCLIPLQANSFNLRTKHHEMANYSRITVTILSHKTL